MSDETLSFKLVEAISENYNKLTNKNNDFDQITTNIDKIILQITCYKDNCPDNKKNFNKFLNYNYKIVKTNLIFDNDIMETFEDSTHDNWLLLHLIIISYLSYLKNIEKNNNVNYKSMITKLMDKIEERNIENDNEIDDDDDDDDNDDNDDREENNNIGEVLKDNNLINLLKKNIQPSEKSPILIKGLLGDIKTMINNNNNNDSKNILEMSKDISTKYQDMIENGDMNINDLLGGIMGLLSNPNTITEEFKDINVENLPDPNNLLTEIKEDPTLKKSIDLVANNSNMDFLGSFMNNMMGNSNETDGKTVQQLEKEIERMMTEVVNSSEK